MLKACGRISPIGPAPGTNSPTERHITMSNQVVLQLDPKRGNSRNSEGAFIELSSGRILFAYTKFLTSSHDDGSALIASRYSDDRGQTWSTRDQTVVPLEDAQNVMSVSLLRLQSGRIALLYLRKDPGVCMPVIRFSDDEGKTFSDPLSIAAPDGYYVVNNDRMIQLQSGRLVIPVAFHRTRGLSKPGETSAPPTAMAPGALIYAYLSDDDGQHWFESVNANYPYFANGHGLQEPGVVELKNGKLWSWSRASAAGLSPKFASQWVSTSDDEGMYWSEAKPSQFLSPCSPMSVKRIPTTGHLLAVWNDHSGRFPIPERKAEWGQKKSWMRTPLVTAISTNEGKSWKHHLVIEDTPDHGYCYTAIHFVDDAVMLAYCAGGASTKLPLDRLRVRRLTIDELYQG